MVLSLDGFKWVDVGLAPIESTGLECLKIWHFYIINALFDSDVIEKIFPSCRSIVYFLNFFTIAGVPKHMAPSGISELTIDCAPITA